jgi:RNA polymerase sporulation-specific sigma factor
MHLRSLKKARKDVSLHDPIGTDKEGNDMTASVYLFFIHPHFYYLPTR